MDFIKNKTRYFVKALCLFICAAIVAQSFAACVSKKDKDAKANTAAPIESAEPVTAEPSTTPEPTDDPSQSPFEDVILAREVKLNYFAIPQEILALMTPADIELYKRVVTACIAGETSVEIPTELGEYPNLWRVVDMYCPLFFVNIKDDTINENETTISWEYTEAEKHNRIIDSFETKVLSYMTSVQDDDTELEKILSVYKDFTSSITYDDTEEGSQYKYRHGKDAILYGRGVCWCFARAFNFMICQLGAVSATVHGLREWDSAIHEWVVFRDGDKWRYADPTWDIGGYALNYFGFTIKTRNNDGFPQNYVTVLEGSKHLASDYFNVSDTFFKPLYTGQCSGYEYEIDHANDRILFNSYYGDGWIAFDLATGEFYDVDY